MDTALADLPLPRPHAGARLQAAAWLTRPVSFLLRQQREHGDVFTMRLPHQAPLGDGLSHPDAVREVFTGDPSKLLAGEANQILRPAARRARSVLLLDGPGAPARAPACCCRPSTASGCSATGS